MNVSTLYSLVGLSLFCLGLYGLIAVSYTHLTLPTTKALW